MVLLWLSRPVRRSYLAHDYSQLPIVRRRQLKSSAISAPNHLCVSCLPNRSCELECERLLWPTSNQNVFGCDPEAKASQLGESNSLGVALLKCAFIFVAIARPSSWCFLRPACTTNFLVHYSRRPSCWGTQMQIDFPSYQIMLLQASRRCHLERVWEIARCQRAPVLVHLSFLVKVLEGRR